jgi:hypothetical protein
MSQFGGKDSKRHFTVVMGGKEHGLYVSSTPSSAAKKAVTKLCTANKSKKVEFHIREITQGSKKKTYGPYSGHIEKLKEPIELKGRVIKYKPVAKLSGKTGAKKGGMPIKPVTVKNIFIGEDIYSSNLAPDLIFLIVELKDKIYTIKFDKQNIKQFPDLYKHKLSNFYLYDRTDQKFLCNLYDLVRIDRSYFDYLKWSIRALLIKKHDIIISSGKEDETFMHVYKQLSESDLNFNFKKDDLKNITNNPRISEYALRLSSAENF